jgi:phage-related protein
MARFFEKPGCCAIFVCGVLLALGSTWSSVSAQDTSVQATSRSDVSLFDSFLDAHTDLDAQLRANPALLNNAEFLEAHPQLQSFLNQHPDIQAQVRQNPSFFMQRQQRFDARENRKVTNPNPDLNRGEVATMDQFLDRNQKIDQDLRRNPSLVNNPEYLESHPQLQTFLNEHPNVKEELTENPKYFMQRENRFDAQEPGRRASNPNPDLTRGELATMDQFLDSHQDIDRTLQRNPWLARNSEYLKEHPDLAAFLNEHPGVKEEITENPKYFMQRESRFDAHETGRRANNPNPDLTRGELATMDQFLDAHQDIDRTLQRNPWLARNAEYLKEHPDLAAFLDQHPGVKEEITENPKYFMERENRFDAHEAGRRANNPNPDLTRGELATMDQFLDSHQDIDRTLQRNPWLARNAEYLKEHPDLAAFLNQHPGVKEEITENPKYFMLRESRFDSQEQARQNRDRDFDRDRDRDDSNRSVTRDRDMDRDRDTDRDRDRRSDVDRRSNLNPDLNNGEVASMDRFLDRHPDVAKSLEKKPELVNDNSYLKRHKDLQGFLSEHPAVREEIKENPSYFMQREHQFEATNRDRDFSDRDRSRDTERSRSDNDRDAAGAGDRNRNDRDADAARPRDRDARDVDNDLSKRELQEMDRFLDKHKKIDKDLQKNPALVNDRDYLKHHKPLESFLAKNPGVGQEIRENPSAFMEKEQRLEARNHRMSQKPAAKPKSKIEQKEEMHPAPPH